MSYLYRVRVVALLCALLGLCSCATAQASGPATSPGAPAAQLGPAGPFRTGADAVTVLRGGPPTFAVLRALIESAARTIHVEVYELGKPDLVQALIAAHARGVAVTVIDDPSELSSAVTAVTLRARGVTVLDYPVRRLMIDHVKLLVVDSDVAVVGGINWGIASPANHDFDAEIRGPAVVNLDRVFMRDLVTCGEDVSVIPPVMDPAILVAATLPATEIRPLALGLIDGARSSIDLELFVLTDTGIVRALEQARRRGVSVHVLLDPSQHSSWPAMQELENGGVDVLLYRSHGELLHAKAMVVDGSRVLFGSANWSGGGFLRNHELDIEIVDAPQVASAMLAQMWLDWQASQ